MSLSYTYDGGAVTHKIAPSAISIGVRAENGEAEFSSIPIEDPGATLTLVGYKPFLVAESACTQPRLLTGYVAQRDIGRSYDATQVIGDERAHGTSIVDVNAALGFRLISGEDGNRPEETWQARLTWLLGSDYLDGLVSTNESWIVTNTVTMDAADYRGGYPASVCDDLRARSGDAYNYFLFYDVSAAEVRLFFDNENETIGTCTLKISNVLDDIDGSIVFPPDMVAKLQREPDKVFSEVVVEYANGGKVFRTRPETEAAFTRRGTTISRPYTGRASTARAQADKWLEAHSTERDRITCTIRVPRASVGLIRAGMGIDIKHTAMPGYEADYVEMRIVSIGYKPIDDWAQFYDVSLELVGAISVVPSEEMHAYLTYHRSYFYGCGANTDYWTDGEAKVAWEYDGDNPPAGYVTEGLEGALEYVDYPLPCGPTWRGGQGAALGFKVTADAVVDLELRGGFAGISADSEATYKISIRQNEDIIWTETYQDDTGGGLHYWGGSVAVDLTGIEAEADDVFSVSTVINLANFAYFASIPSDAYADTRFRISGLSGSVTTGDDLVPPSGPVGSTLSTTDPTVDDDSTAGFAPGDIWINTTTGEAWIAIGVSPGSAVWELITNEDGAGDGSETLSQVIHGRFLYVGHKGSDERTYLLESDDGITFTEIEGAVVVPTTGDARDPTFLHWDGSYWIAHTTYSGSSVTFRLWQSDDLVSWTNVANPDMSGARTGATACWAPTWFVDPADNSVHIFAAVGTGGEFPSDHKLYETHPTNRAMTTWSTPVEVTGTGFPSTTIDAFMVYAPDIGTAGKPYKLWWVNDSGGARNIGYSESAALTSGYSVVQSGNWAGWQSSDEIEAPCVVQLDDGRWRIYFNKHSGITSLAVYYSDSTDEWATWTARAEIDTPELMAHGDVVVLRSAYDHARDPRAHALGGDLAGLSGEAIVAGLQGRAVASDAPADGEILTWDDGASEWAPAAAPVTVTADDISAMGFVGSILISDTPSTPLVFADLIQNEAQDDLVYADPT